MKDQVGSQEQLSLRTALLDEELGSNGSSIDDKTVDVRSAGPERSQELVDLSQSTIVQSHARRGWRQLVVVGSSNLWLVEMSDDGRPIIQSLRISREGKPNVVSDLEQLLQFEERMMLDHEPWPGNVIVTSNLVV